MGDKGVVNIERESKLSGSIHDKGVLILQGYLGATYARRRPLALSASITFEQNYGGVDGDSASSTELYALLSSLADLPIKQGLAVTGSINQRGEIQPIGGVNEKIEGFFEVCREKRVPRRGAGGAYPPPEREKSHAPRRGGRGGAGGEVRRLPHSHGERRESPSSPAWRPGNATSKRASFPPIASTEK